MKGFKNQLSSVVPVVLALAAAIVLGQLAPMVTNAYIYSIIVYACINVIMAVSLNLVIGLAGQFSMGHAGFMAVGGYVAAYLSLTYGVSTPAPSFMPLALYQNLFFAGALVAGGLAAAALGYVVGLPSLRLKGDYLAIVTLGFGEIIRVIILNVDAVGGARGLPGIPQQTNLSWVLAIGVITVVTVRRLMASSHGRALLAVREDEIAAEAMGVNTTQSKVRAFILGAFFAGVSGGLFAHFLTYMNPQSFDFNKSFEYIIMVVLGGMGSTTGAVIAALFLTGVKELLRPLQEITKVDLRMIIFALLLISLMLLRPNGFFGTRELTDFGPFRRFKNKPGMKKAPTP